MSAIPNDITLDEDQVAVIRQMLVLGLACYSEIESKREASEIATLGGEPWPEGSVPLLQTADRDATCRFAEALMYVV